MTHLEGFREKRSEKNVCMETLFRTLDIQKEVAIVDAVYSYLLLCLC